MSLPLSAASWVVDPVHGNVQFNAEANPTLTDVAITIDVQLVGPGA